MLTVSPDNAMLSVVACMSSKLVCSIIDSVIDSNAFKILWNGKTEIIICDYILLLLACCCHPPQPQVAILQYHQVLQQCPKQSEHKLIAIEQQTFNETRATFVNNKALLSSIKIYTLLVLTSCISSYSSPIN